MVEATASPMPPEPSRRRPWIGPAAALGLAALLFLAGITGGHRVPNPNLLFALILVFGSYLEGLGSGLAAAAIALAFTAWDWSIPGHPLAYTHENLARLVVAAVCMPAMALLVGMLKARSSAQHRAIAHFLTLERERNRQLAIALDQAGHPQGGIPICAWCHKVRGEDGRWDSLEAHLAQKLGYQITHGICPECLPAFGEQQPKARAGR